MSVGALIVGFGAVTWRSTVSDNERYVAIAVWLARAIGPLAAGFLLLTLLVEPSLPEAVERPYHVAIIFAGALFLLRQGLLLRERSRMLAVMERLQGDNQRLVEDLQAELVERVRVQDQLIGTSRMAAVGELAAGVAHEVNNPLTGVLGYAELLLEDIDEDDPQRADVVTIRDEAMRARGIIRALRDFARPHEPRPVPTDLPDLVARTLELVRYQLVQAGVIIAESHGEMPLIQLDPQAIQQVILNVLTNALQAMPDGGRLQVHTSVRDTAAVVTITDTGVGMDESVAAQAFVPFFSARHASGAPGLGLSVSLGLVEGHRGTIRLESRAGVGTTVEVCLPIGPDAAARAGPDEAPLT